MKKTIKAHEERDVKTKDAESMPEGALPTYLLDRENQNNAKALSSAVKQKRKEKAGKFMVPLPKVRGIAEDEMFKVVKTGKTKRKGWKRMVTKATFVGEVGNLTSAPRATVALIALFLPPGLYAQATQARAIHPSICTALQEGQRYASYALLCRSIVRSWLTADPSRAQGYLPAAHHWRQEEPSITHGEL